MPAAFSLVMLDVDGVLVDTVPEISAALNAALAEVELRAVDETLVRRWIGHGARELMMRAYCDAAKDDGEPRPQVLGTALRAFEWHYAATSGTLGRPYPGAIEGLRALKALGVAVALVTNKEISFTAPLLHAHGLWKHLDMVVCGDMLPEKMPHPLPLEHCLARCSTPRERALLIGGCDIGLAAARSADVAAWTPAYGRRGGATRWDRAIPTIQAAAEAIAAIAAA